VTVRDVLTGGNLAEIRDDRSQQWVADAMRERGWKWSQATVWSVEKGERPLKLWEAEDLADILEVSVSRLTAMPLPAAIRSRMDACASLEQQLQQNTADFLAAQASLRHKMKLATRAGEWLDSTLTRGGGWLGTSPEMIVREATDRWKHKNDAEETLLKVYLDEAQRARGGTGDTDG
jgi:hypothetical protein